jgi:hypothetical protein
VSTFFSEVSDYSNLATLKDVGLGIVGVYAANKAADLIPIGGKTGGIRALKTAGAAVGIGFLGDKFLGPREGRDLAMGGLLLAGFEGLNAMSGGKYGAWPAGSGAPAMPANAQGALNPAAAGGYGQQPLITTGLTIPTTQGLANNASGVASGFSSGTGL